MQILVKKWDESTRIQLVLDLLLKRTTDKEIAHTRGISRHEVKQMVCNIIGTRKVNPNHGVIVYKDHNLVCRDHNYNALFLGEKRHLQTMTGLSDKDIYHKTPEIAHEISAIDQTAIDSMKKFNAKKMIMHNELGPIEAEADTYPVIGDNGNNAGVLVLGHFIFSFYQQPFKLIMEIIHKGMVRQFLNKEKYYLRSMSRNVLVTGREMECIIYLIVNMDTKLISKRMQLSPKTIDNMILRLKSKLDLNSRQEFSHAAFTYGWLKE